MNKICKLLFDRCLFIDDKNLNFFFLGLLVKMLRSRLSRKIVIIVTYV